MSRATAPFARILKLLQRQGRSKEESEDLIHDAWLRVHEYRKTTEIRNEEAVLTQTAVRLSIDKHRKDQRHPHAAQDIEQLERSVPLVHPGPAPDEVFSTLERLDQVERALDAVSVRTRQIYIAHRAGYSYEEIARALGISESTVEKHIARAVQRLMDMRERE